MGVRKRSRSVSGVEVRVALANSATVPAPPDACYLCGENILAGAGVQIPYIYASDHHGMDTYKWFHSNCAVRWFETHVDDRDHVGNLACLRALYMENGRFKYQRH